MSSSTAVSSARERLPGLDGVRALAIVLVLAYHLFPGLAPGGFVGVDVFLVVSGYLITALLLAEHERTGRIALGRFWHRRARRLLPALALVIGVSAAAAAIIGGDVLVGIGWQLVGAATFSSNWLAIAQGASYLDQTSPELLRHAWSLAVEEQFYLLWPLALLALLLVPRRGVRVLAVAALAVASAVGMAVVAGDPVASPAAASTAYYSTLTHGSGLLAGAALAIARAPLSGTRARATRIPAAVADAIAAIAALGIVAAASALAIDDALVYRGGIALVVMLTLVLLVAADHPSGCAAAVLDAPLPRWVGERSYGLYLWHWPIIVLLCAALPTVERTGASGWILGAVALTASVALAAASYRWLEQPVRREGLGLLWRPERRVGRLALAAALVVATAVGAGAAVVRAPDASSAAAAIAAGEAALRAPSEPPTPSVPPEPIITTAPAPPPSTPPGEELLAIGDSVMLASAPALQERFPGIAIDAAVSRQMHQAPEILRGLAERGELRPVVVLALGTNGPIRTETLDEVRRILGPERELVLVTTQAPRGWTDDVNSTLSDFADRYLAVELSDWQSAIRPRLDLLAGDQIHPGPTGGKLYAEALEAPLTRLASLPRVADYLPDPLDER
ncbi:hypothetical protein GCM10009792_04050 [Microcella alkalica]|uniref:Peptidoglycan/LPS O-acetylase OafA/YrhL n=1 Tax=Microcella alkalica TaxID=355930 RepID=A0A839ECQ7_9MICO|nr:acyltransferase family protein [Microcella alkalica]MBA8848986.1 peptidoglycan/LPS O-acetylase OafA/YrhL [Microcella alkalica]